MHYEAGIKLATSPRWRLAANLFSTRYEDYQEAAFVGAQFTVGNAEKVELEGFELEGMLLLGERVTADFAVSFADMVYGRHQSAPCFPGRAPDSPLNNGACDLTGAHPVNAPQWKTHSGLQYDAPLAWGALSLRADWSWTDDYNTNFSGDPRLQQAAYSWINLRAGITVGDWEAVLWAENVADETVVNYDAVLTLYAGDGSYQSMMQAPRSFGVTLRVNY
jgi:iron complex outermembrane receptor protein